MPKKIIPKINIGRSRGRKIIKQVKSSKGFMRPQAQALFKILALVILIIALGLGFYLSQNRLPIYSDTTNHVQFSYPKEWKAGQVIPNHVMVGDGTANGLSVLIKVNQPQEFVKGLGLSDGAETYFINNKEMKIRHSEYVVPSDGGEAKKLTYTHLYWVDGTTGNSYIIEITPSQKDGFDSEVLNILKSLKAV